MLPAGLLLDLGCDPINGAQTDPTIDAAPIVTNLKALPVFGLDEMQVVGSRHTDKNNISDVELLGIARRKGHAGTIVASWSDPADGSEPSHRDEELLLRVWPSSFHAPIE